MQHEKIIGRMSLAQKCALLTGAGAFHTCCLVEVPSIHLADGPHGLRKQAGDSDHLGLNPSVEATCFPTAAAIANGWDIALGEAIGRALGEEAAAQQVAVILDPGLNMKRNPLCGRNFEYFPRIPTWLVSWLQPISGAFRDRASPPAPSILLPTTRSCAD